MKKGLSVIYDPHNLYQFIWYYCNNGKVKKWDALCLPNGYKGEYMHTYCQASGIFQQVFKSNTDFSSLSANKKLCEFAKMLLFFIGGKRNLCCKMILNRFVDIDAYDEIVIIADVGLVSGACCALGKEKKVVILEDGIGDYTERFSFIPKGKILSPYNWQGWILSLMGYCSPGWYKLKTNAGCIKYCSHPDKMSYRNYKEIRLLYDEKNTDYILMDKIIKRIYPMIKEIDFDGADAIVLTRPLEDYVSDIGLYHRRIEEFIKSNYQYILLKKHPRENNTYSFDDSTQVVEVDNEIPAEVLLPYLKGKELVVVSTSAIILYVKSFDITCKVIMFKDMQEDNNRSKAKYQLMTKNEAEIFCGKYAEGMCELLYI